MMLPHPLPLTNAKFLELLDILGYPGELSSIVYNRSVTVSDEIL